MKRTLSILLMSIVLFSCGNNTDNKTLTDAKNLQSDIQKMQPGGIPTSEGSWTMTAKINGKDWKANSIMPPDMAGRIAGNDNTTSIGLPYDRRGMVVGKKNKFSHDNAVDLMLPSSEGGILGGYNGEMEITKVDDKWVEGKFFFSGSSGSSDSKAEVTEGFFRISTSGK